VFKLAQDLGLTNDMMVAKLQQMGLDVHNYMSLIDSETARKVKSELRSTRCQQQEEQERFYFRAGQPASPVCNDAEQLFRQGEQLAIHDQTQAVLLWIKAAEIGQAEACNRLGHCYAKGEGVPKSTSQARQYWEKAAALGNVDALFNLGASSVADMDKLLIVGDNTASFVLDCWRSAAQRGHPQAKYMLARCHEKGVGTSVNLSEAIRLYTESGNAGFLKAQRKLGWLYHTGRFVPLENIESLSNNDLNMFQPHISPDPSAALYWHTLAANQGERDSQYQVGRSFASPDPTRAIPYLRSAYSQGHEHAGRCLADCYLKSGHYHEAVACLNSLYDSYSRSKPFASLRLAVHFASVGTDGSILSLSDGWWGRLYDTDSLENIVHHIKAANLDVRSVLSCLHNCADGGRPWAQLILSEIYDKGIAGCDKDDGRSMKLLAKAANLLSEAQYILGCVYSSGGRGVRQNDAEAKAWLTRAADFGHPKAKKKLKESGCFISTAAAKSLGWTDDGPELDSLRRLRDTYMQATEERSAEVETYYRIAPGIVEAISSSPEAKKTWRDIGEQWLGPILELAQRGDARRAHQLYRAMVTALDERFGKKTGGIPR
jgi:TPR repeat protein